MKTTMAIALLLALPALAEEKKAAAKASPKSGKAAKAAPAPKAEVPPPYNGPPPGSEKISSTEWRWVDKNGKAWVYRRGPMTWMKQPAEDAAVKDTAVSANLRAVDKGDSVEFTRTIPIGISKYTKKKSELNAEEQSVLAASLQEKK